MLQRQGQKLRRLSNLFGCRDPEYVSPERSRSATPSDPTSGKGDGDPLEDEDVKARAAKPDDVSSSPGFHRIKRRKMTLTHCSLI